jgi:ferritin-like metal-binding protein YciE
MSEDRNQLHSAEDIFQNALKKIYALHKRQKIILKKFSDAIEKKKLELVRSKLK